MGTDLLNTYFCKLWFNDGLHGLFQVGSTMGGTKCPRSFSLKRLKLLYCNQAWYTN